MEPAVRCSRRVAFFGASMILVLAGSLVMVMERLVVMMVMERLVMMMVMEHLMMVMEGLVAATVGFLRVVGSPSETIKP